MRDGGPVTKKPPLPNFFKSFDLPKVFDIVPLISPLNLPQKFFWKKDSEFVVIRYPRCSQQLASHLKLDRDVSFEELKNYFYGDNCLASISPEISLHTLAVTNDPEYTNQTHLTSLHATEAYNFLYGPSGPTSQVTIAIIDSGVDIDHEDFSGNLWVNSNETAGNSVDDDHNGYVDDVNGYNFASNTANPRPQAWPAPNTGGESHGTHVAGLAAAKADNSKGIAGVMGKNIKIMSLNVFGATAGASTTNIINAIYYAIDNGADIINLSLGGYGVSESIFQALKNAAASGVMVFAAAGNDGSLLDDGHFILPASYAQSIMGVLSVGATDDNDGKIAWFSNYSSRYVEIASSGTHSGNNGLKSTLPGNSYGFKQGTSMATPVAAGVAAWAISYLKSLGVTPTPMLVEQFLQETSDTVPDLYGKVSRGQRLNLLSLVNKIGDCF
ncbi:MAG: hypothetical protein A4S09_07975 [Proteobacteria bacterium SG_bin7]|nr:MAG: hypothetical protein A4S09_07975 [Proteobacteria bacterium SG_bin7]